MLLNSVKVKEHLLHVESVNQIEVKIEGYMYVGSLMVSMKVKHGALSLVIWHSAEACNDPYSRWEGCHFTCPHLFI